MLEGLFSPDRTNRVRSGAFRLTRDARTRVKSKGLPACRTLSPVRSVDKKKGPSAHPPR